MEPSSVTSSEQGPRQLVPKLRRVSGEEAIRALIEAD
jgi:hypothetical protein